MLNTDIFNRESWRVTEVDLTDEKSGAEVGNSVKSSRIRKPVPPPEGRDVIGAILRTAEKI